MEGPEGGSGHGRVTVVRADPYLNKYEWLQVLLVVLLFCAHFVLLGVVLLGGVYIGLPVGLFEVVVSWKTSARLTFRATESPTSVRSALRGLRPWLLGFGAFMAIFSACYTVAIIIWMNSR
jgi:hypothetical protein